MIDIEDTPACGIFIIPNGSEQFNLRPFNNMEDKIPEEDFENYEFLLAGLCWMAGENAHLFVTLGRMLFELDGDEVVFEAADELRSAIADSKIIPFKKKH